MPPCNIVLLHFKITQHGWAFLKKKGSLKQVPDGSWELSLNLPLKANVMHKGLAVLEVDPYQYSLAQPQQQSA